MSFVVFIPLGYLKVEIDLSLRRCIRSRISGPSSSIALALADTASGTRRL